MKTGLRKRLAVLMSAAVLFGCLAVGNVFMAGAATVTGGTAAALTAAPAEHSLLTGLSPIANAATDHAKYVAYKSSLSPLTDGAYPGINALVQPVRDESGALVNNNDSHPEYGIKNTAGALVTCFSCWTNDYIDLTFDLGESAPITGFAVGNTAEPTPLLKEQAADWTDEQIMERYAQTAQTSFRLFKGAFYAADTPEALFSAAAPALEWDYSGETMPQAVRFTLDEARTGRYVGFRLYYYGTEWQRLFRIGELAVFGEPEPETRSIVCLGDSITYGAHFPNGTTMPAQKLENRYAVQLESLLNGAGDAVQYTVREFGLGGSAVVAGSLVGDSVVSYYDGMWAPNTNGVQNAVAAADVVTVMLGTNDAANGTVDRWNTGVRMYFKQEYRKLIAAIRAVNPAAQVYIATSPVSLRRLYYGNLATGVVPAQLELAAELGCGVIDVYNRTRDLVRDDENHEAAFISAYEIDYLRVHPGEAGHTVIAQAFYDSLHDEKTTVSILRASKTAAADGAVNEYAPVQGGYKGVVNDANRVPAPAHNLLATAVSAVGFNGTAAHCTNGVLPFVDSLATDDHLQTNMGNLTFDLGRTSSVTQLLLGGAMTAMNQTAFLLRGYDVYITDNPQTLTAQTLAVSVHDLEQTADFADAVGRLYTLPRTMSGRYVVMKLDTVTGGMWFTELAAIGYRPAEEKAVTLGAEARLGDVPGLRFGFEINEFTYTGAAGAADWDNNRTIGINGASCTLVRVGALVGISAAVGTDKAALTLERVCGKILDVEAQNLYSVEENAITYTAVVVRIPEEHRAENIDARPYIQYLDAAGHLETLYGEVITRSYQGVLDGDSAQ